MFEKSLLKDQTVFITGGGTGLGRAMALRFAELGARIFMTARREEPLAEACEAIRAAGGSAAYHSGCDVRNFEAVEEAVAKAHEEFGSVNVLVNNSAGNFISPTERLSPNAFNAVIGIVLNGTFHCTLAMGRKWMEAKQPGTVLNILATYVWTGSGYVVPSACAKSGVLALTRSLAVEWARHGIRHVAIAPGPFPTEGAWSRISPGKSWEDEHIRQHPMGRFGTHDELTNLASFLISPGAAYINGDCITIDGGQWLRHGGQFNDLGSVPDETWDKMAEARRSKP